MSLERIVSESTREGANFGRNPRDSAGQCSKNGFIRKDAIFRGRSGGSKESGVKWSRKSRSDGHLRRANA